MNKHVHLCLGVAALALLSGCAERGNKYFRPIPVADYPRADGPGEVMQADEVEAAARIAAIIQAHLLRMYEAAPVQRDAHPKQHGCVKAKFTVQDNLPPELRRGLFATPATYDAIIRYSNSNEDPTRPDYDKDARGMAVKVLGTADRPLPGTPLTVAPKAGPSQDFIMINFPTFLVAEPTDYVKLVGFNNSSDKLTQWLQPVLTVYSIGIKGTLNAVRATGSRIDNPFNARYFSMVPYQLGSGSDAVAVKYSAMACEPEPVVIPDTKDPNYLRAVMVKQLSRGSACMKFMVQVRTPTMSVEDSRYEWSESKAPFHEVARIEIPQQEFNTEPLQAACTATSYSPWHSLPEHKPLSAVNRMRKAIYERIFALRQETAGR